MLGASMDLEGELGKLCANGELHRAATRAIEGYGPEVLGFLVTLLRSESDAGDVFAQACEDLWVGLPKFERRSSLRSWFYTLARHAAARFRRSPHQRRPRATPSEAGDLAARVRSQTLPHDKSEVKVGVAQIRDSLDDDDRTLLVLRVDRDMSWSDIARVMAEPDEPLDRVAARLRKRFQHVKERIRERALEMGLLDA
jgi:RNA polymerase sigma-70 factor, ECF subfamily